MVTDQWFYLEFSLVGIYLNWSTIQFPLTSVNFLLALSFSFKRLIEIFIRRIIYYLIFYINNSHYFILICFYIRESVIRDFCNYFYKIYELCILLLLLFYFSFNFIIYIFYLLFSGMCFRKRFILSTISSSLSCFLIGRCFPLRGSYLTAKYIFLSNKRML